MEFNKWNGKNFSDVVGDFKNSIEDFIEFVETVKETYYKDKDVDSEMLRKQNDLLHDLELDDLKYHEIARLGKEIRQLRRNRREYKNEYLLAESIKDFYKDNYTIVDLKKLSGVLDTLQKRLIKDSEIIQNQYYNKRSTIDNISTLKKDSDDRENSEAEEIIQLNRVLKKYCINLESKKETLNDDCIIYAKMQLEKSFKLNAGKKILNELGNNIERFYKPHLADVTCDVKTSDMLLTDEYGKNILTGTITIYQEYDVLYTLHITIREGKQNSNSASKKGKKGKKHGRR